MVLLDKPTGISSFAALSSVKRAFNTRKVGHTGTLDPFASGLLIALVGPATRTARLFDGAEKSYEARFCFGHETDTDDCTGTPTSEGPLPNEAMLRSLVPEFSGSIEQIPPSYSAVHINGTRAYELARQGRAVAPRSRLVEIHELSLDPVGATSAGVSEAIVRLRCSTGTYVRSIARDLARRAGSRGHVSELRRLSIGPFRVDQATAPGDLTQNHALSLQSALSRLPGVVVIDVSHRIAERVVHGQPIAPSELPTPEAGSRDVLLCSSGRAIALTRIEGARMRYLAVFPQTGDHATDD